MDVHTNTPFATRDEHECGKVAAAEEDTDEIDAESTLRILTDVSSLQAMPLAVVRRLFRSEGAGAAAAGIYGSCRWRNGPSLC
jgi:hypothetical protein